MVVWVYSTIVASEELGAAAGQLHVSVEHRRAQMALELGVYWQQLGRTGPAGLVLQAARQYT